VVDQHPDMGARSRTSFSSAEVQVAVGRAEVLDHLGDLGPQALDRLPCARAQSTTAYLLEMSMTRQWAPKNHQRSRPSIVSASLGIVALSV